MMINARVSSTATLLCQVTCRSDTRASNPSAAITIALVATVHLMKIQPTRPPVNDRWLRFTLLNGLVVNGTSEALVSAHAHPSGPVDLATF